jgi:hypothetical protein
MAVSLRVTPVPQSPLPNNPETPRPEPQKPESRVPAALAAPAHVFLARLAALHDEAAETAHLANLLGRALWAAGLVGAGALGVAAVTAQWAPPVELGLWLALVAVSVATLGRTYAQAIEAPFDRMALQSFTQSLSAILLYAGTAWGAGVFLALPAGSGLAGAIAFTAGMSALVAGVLRARDIAFSFIVPATFMGAFCALMVTGSAVTALGIVAGGLVVAAATVLFDRLSMPLLYARHG